MSEKSDKRVAARKDLNVLVTLGHKSRLQEFYSRNISGGGIFLETEDLMPIGTKVELRFSIPGRKQALTLTAQVVRHHVIQSMDEEFNPSETHGMGLAFVDLTGDQEKIIEQYVAGNSLAIQG